MSNYTPTDKQTAQVRDLAEEMLIKAHDFKQAQDIADGHDAYVVLFGAVVASMATIAACYLPGPGNEKLRFALCSELLNEFSMHFPKEFAKRLMRRLGENN